MQSILGSCGVRGIPHEFCCRHSIRLLRGGVFHRKQWESEEFLQFPMRFLSDSSWWKSNGIHVLGNVEMVLVCNCRIRWLSGSSFHWVFNHRTALISYSIDPRGYLWPRVPTIIRSLPEYSWQSLTGLRSCLVGVHRILL